VARFLDAEQRRMLDRRGRNAEAVEESEKVCGRRGHTWSIHSEIGLLSNGVFNGAPPVALTGRFWHRTAL
jgi:hypothetical protein